MSKFRVGQRVWIKWSAHYPEFDGKECTIVGPAEPCLNWYTGEEWIGYPVDINPLFCPQETQLEPATDSYDVVSWKDCAWQPEHLRAEA